MFQRDERKGRILVLWAQNKLVMCIPSGVKIIIGNNRVLNVGMGQKTKK
ncbi:hypothetical protein KAM621c_37330 [Citrobacter braakii]|uniref:Uncharacterized protein n=1 Tax=Citrobacter braakii TaxID=57706 RepID=A0AAD1L4A9_CITBR|nr:hypothetical protein KAM621c_37330 [Citrobacter braakii]